MQKTFLTITFSLARAGKSVYTEKQRGKAPKFDFEESATTLTEEIGAKIKYYRKKRGLKIAELAALLHKTGANAYDRG